MYLMANFFSWNSSFAFLAQLRKNYAPQKCHTITRGMQCIVGQAHMLSSPAAATIKNCGRLLNGDRGNTVIILSSNLSISLLT